MIRDQEIVVIVILVFSFSLLLTRFPNFSAISTLWWDRRASKKTCALIGYQRVQKMCFLLIPSFIPKKEKKEKRNASSLLNTSYNEVTKQFMFVI